MAMAADSAKTSDISAHDEDKTLPASALMPPAAAVADDVPNGGAQAWLHVLGAFMLYFNTWGILNTFGAFQTFYSSGTLFVQTSSNISWIGSIQAFLVLFTGFLSGPIYDQGYLRALLLVGSFLIVFGNMMLSLATDYPQVLLAQGVCVGLGSGLIYVPAVAVLPTYFNTRLGLAIGLAASGSSIGGIIYPVVFYKLINQIGFSWSVRVVGFIALATLIIPNLVMKMRVKPPKARALLDTSALSDWPFLIFTSATLIGFMGLYTMFFYLSYYTKARHITSTALSFYLVPILNAASILGRVLPNAVSDKIGAFNLIGPGAVIVSVIIFGMLGAKSVASVVILAILFGFFSGIFIALPPVCIVRLTKDRANIGTRMGMAFGIIGLGVFVGGPGGGAILASGGGDNFNGLWVFGGAASLVSSVLFMVVRAWKAGCKMIKV
ncbi:Major facilitator superfamily domain, general substrate transporter [Metarhizium album ARSEF 1941]|uniref:Major facilitator superfamily domain, general substrate transporter n=1 Tax=Metarhizium album (strain ARSEF 1941) TaxID=1081103 RepID=A0A0B2WQ27_METAS|nr:Major facilitator superfamily domain, general substrate transporter [Metarhizium album ARSEF 1941]KHN95592.1 Major facilitator superfamily domain, general substrate transporter [Metarhizium album ARSEF 1941]